MSGLHHHEAVAQLKSNAEKVATFRIDDVLPAPHLRETLAPIVQLLEVAQYLASKLANVSWDEIPQPMIEQCTRYFQTALASVEGYRTLLNDPNKAQLQAVNDILRETQGGNSPHRGHFSMLKMSVEGLQIVCGSAALGGHRAEAVLGEIEKFRDDASIGAEKILSIVSATEGLAQKGGASAHALDFQKLVSEHEKRGNWWLVACLSATTISLIVVACMSFKVVPMTETGEPVKWLALFPEVFGISTFTGLAVWAGRQHASHRHQHTICAHKATGLATFQSFVGAAATDEVRAAVLLECTRSIFTIPDTGYLKGAGPGGAGTVVNNMFETLKPQA